MDQVIDPVPVPTDIIRTPAAGPKPANTLAFLQCRASAADIQISRTDLVEFAVQFKTQFQIGGFVQANHPWYVKNTRVSATGMVRLASASTDFEFVLGIDTVDPFIDVDGVLGFHCHFGMQIDGLGFLEGSAGLDAVFNVCAYVLLFEPRVEMPPSGPSGQRWHDPRRLERSIGIIERLGPKRATSIGEVSRLTVKRPESSRLLRGRGREDC